MDEEGDKIRKLIPNRPVRIRRAGRSSSSAPRSGTKSGWCDSAMRPWATTGTGLAVVMVMMAAGPTSKPATIATRRRTS